MSPRKQALRAAALARRRTMPPDERDRADREIATAAAAAARLHSQDPVDHGPGIVIDGDPAPVPHDRRDLAESGTVVCAYRPFATEPGGPYLLDALASAGVRVLLPVMLPDRDLDWIRYEPGGQMRAPRPCSSGRESSGRESSARESLGRDAIRDAGLVLVPALAVDEAGVRLGRGGGSYDRALVRVPAAIPVVALLYEGERHTRLPAEPHDRHVTAVITPRGLQLIR